MASIAEAPIRRIVTADDARGVSFPLHDGPVENVLRDPARPGFANVRLWATASSPAEASSLAHASKLAETLGAPPGGSAFRILVVPPDAGWTGSISDAAVRAYFDASGTPDAWSGGRTARHPYMQQVATLELCVILEGEVTLVLDTAEVSLAAGDSVVQRATRHAWSNRTSKPCVIAVTSHDAE